jgi:hypothetical protein
MYLAAFCYEEYNEKDLPLYVFYDVRLMDQAALKRADTFINLATKYGFKVHKIGLEELEGLLKFKPKGLLIVFQPFKSKTGSRIWSGIPSILIDPDEDGFVEEGKSPLSDWIRRGLVFINMMDEAPNPWLIARNGSVYKLNKFFDSVIMGLSGIFRGKGYKVSEPSELGQLLGINGWGAWWAPSLKILESVNITYLTYGRILLDDIIIINPVFIKAEEGGGWVYLGDGRNLQDREIAHDIMMIVIHAPWNGIPASCATSTAYFPRGGQVRELATVSLPLNGGLERVKYLRLILIAYSSDYQRYIISTTGVGLRENAR